MFRLAILLLSLLCVLDGVCVADGDDLSGVDRAFFENRIRPVLAKQCFECHSAGSKEGGGKLLLDSRDGLSKGGQSGPAVVAGKPNESLIIDSLRYDGLEMPPEKPLRKAVINDFVTWVRRGAKYPRPATPPKKTDVLAEPELDREALWSFLPRRSHEVPEIQKTDWPTDLLDHFILAKIEAAAQSPVGDAAPNVLIRRLHFDLIGLSPMADEIVSFSTAYHNDRAAAIERLVDSLLERPQFGERWGRHWLDVARYAESNGDDGLGRNATFPHAWRYRDYVIDSFNNDLPYNRFLTEQIAGDLLPAKNATERNRQLIATGFLAIGAKPAAAMNKNFQMDIVDDQINVVTTAAMGLSVSCARCHDHKHDPIPTRDYYALAGIFTNTRTLYGAAANEKLTAPPTALHELTSHWNPDASRDVATKTPLTFPDAYSSIVDQLRPAIHAKLDSPPSNLSIESAQDFSPTGFAKVKATNIHGQLPSAGDSYSVAFWFRNDTPNKKRPITAYLFSRAKSGDKSLPGDHIGIGGNHESSRTGKLFVFNGNVSKKSLPGTTVIQPGTWNHVVLVRSGADAKLFLNGNLEIDGSLEATFGDSTDFCLANRSDKFSPLVGNLAEFAVWQRALSRSETDTLYLASGRPRGAQIVGVAMGVREKDSKIADCKIHIGGETAKPGPAVSRGFLSAYAKVQATNDLPPAESNFEIDAKQSGRRELAAWLTDPNHPQTARVMANRVWLQLFGRGIVVTPDDFGVYGARPTHPELLDHLADRFVQGGWSVKRLIRAIVLSRTYQLDSRSNESLTGFDPENELFARHSRRRLDAEALRDRILQASGRLDLNPPGGSAIEKIDQLINWPPGAATNLHRHDNHRSVYLCMLRHSPPPELAAFDLPDGTAVVGQRDETISPSQSLFLLNNPFVVKQSLALASDIPADENHDESVRIAAVFRRILRRDPTEAETRRAIGYLESIAVSLNHLESLKRQHKSWASLCQALFATNEFCYID
jgi:hypothetical protein